MQSDLVIFVPWNVSIEIRRCLNMLNVQSIFVVFVDLHFEPVDRRRGRCRARSVLRECGNIVVLCAVHAVYFGVGFYMHWKCQWIAIRACFQPIFFAVRSLHFRNTVVDYLLSFDIFVGAKSNTTTIGPFKMYTPDRFVTVFCHWNRIFRNESATEFSNARQCLSPEKKTISIWNEVAGCNLVKTAFMLTSAQQFLEMFSNRVFFLLLSCLFAVCTFGWNTKCHKLNSKKRICLSAEKCRENWKLSLK